MFRYIHYFICLSLVMWFVAILTAFGAIQVWENDSSLQRLWKGNILDEYER